MSANILSPSERQELVSIPTEISDDDLVRFFELSSIDQSIIDPRLEISFRFDQAAHICILRWLGWSPVAVDRLPEKAQMVLCQQLSFEISRLHLQPPSERSSRRHAENARVYLGWKKYSSEMEQSLIEWITPMAEGQDQGSVLFQALCSRLYQEQIVRPGLAYLERLVELVRNTVRERIAHEIISKMRQEQMNKLDELLVVQPGETTSRFQYFKATPKRASGNELIEVLERVEAIRGLCLPHIDLLNEGSIHPNRVKILARRAKQRTNWDTARLLPQQRYLLLVCFFDQTLHDYVDLAVSIYVETIKSIFQRAETKRDKEIMERGKTLNDKVIILGRLARLILDENGIPDADLRQAIYHLVSRDRLAHTVNECDEIAQPADYNPMNFAAHSYSYLRHFVPRFIEVMQFQTEGNDHPLIEAIQFMRAVENGQQAFEQAPLQFIPRRWKTYVVNEKNVVNRQMYELCLHDCLAKAIEHGELWIPDSRTYTSFKKDWISDKAWPEARQTFLAQFPDLADADAFIQQAQEVLDAQMAETNRVWPDLQNEVWIEDDAVHLARLEAREQPEGIDHLQDQLINLFPRIGIAQLLLEVNHWIGVDRLLTNLNTQEHPIENLTAKKIAVLMAEGMNIGLQNMSGCVQGMSYSDLAGVNDRYFREDTLHQAIVAVVNFYHKLPITRYWGDGTASSSDGQIFGVPVKTIHAQYHPESPCRSGRAVNVYTHVSDHGIPFYGQVIHHISQEGAYVLDGLLYHETDLTPQHHFVDTGGYQDTLWGACHLLGFSLEPRIRDIGDMRLFRMHRKVEEYPNIQVLFPEAINMRAIRENWDHILRLIASIHSGIVPASQILSKLDAYHPESGIFKALREVGRIAKTMFLLDYFTQRQIRQRVQKGLNRVESYHALVRSLFIGQAGVIRQRELVAQLNRVSCLQLVAAMIMTWNAAYLDVAVKKLDMEGVTIKPEQLAHILPSMSEHINRLGRYEFNLATEVFQTDISTLSLRSATIMAKQLGLNTK